MINFFLVKGAPYVCTICNGVGHLKSECPDLIVPNMIDLPSVDDKWLSILSRLCRQITGLTEIWHHQIWFRSSLNLERCRPNKNDIDNRKQILSHLEQQLQKDCPECRLHAFGSFYNGFGFQQSDLDVCLVFKDGREQNVGLSNFRFHLDLSAVLDRGNSSNFAKDSTSNEVFQRICRCTTHS